MKSDYMFETTESDYEALSGVLLHLPTKAYTRAAYSSSKTFIQDDVLILTPNEFQSLNIAGNFSPAKNTPRIQIQIQRLDLSYGLWHTTSMLLPAASSTKAA